MDKREYAINFAYRNVAPPVQKDDHLFYVYFNDVHEFVFGNSPEPQIRRENEKVSGYKTEEAAMLHYRFMWLCLAVLIWSNLCWRRSNHQKLTKSHREKVKIERVFDALIEKQIKPRLADLAAGRSSPTRAAYGWLQFYKGESPDYWINKQKELGANDNND